MWAVGGSTFSAELWAVEIGLRHAWGLGVRRLICASDCMEVVRVMQMPIAVDIF